MSLAYDKDDVSTIMIEITTPDDTSIEFPIAVNGEDFFTEIGFATQGSTTIGVRGLSDSGELLYRGEWEGIIYSSHKTNIVIHLLDQEVKETYTGNMPPFIQSIYINPSNIEPGQTTNVLISSDDLNDDEMRYEIFGLDSVTGCDDCMGAIEINHEDSGTLDFSYHSSVDDIEGDKRFSVRVYDSNDMYSTIDGLFTMQKRTTIETGMSLNSHPIISNLNSTNSYLYKDLPFTDITVKIEDYDGDVLNYEWSLTKVDGFGECSIDDIEGEMSGYLSPSDEKDFHELSLRYSPNLETIDLPRTCQFDLVVRDSKNARVDGTIQVKTGPVPVNHNPSIVYYYQNAKRAPPDSLIDFMIVGKDLDGDDLTFTWDALYDVGEILLSNEIKRNNENVIPFEASSSASLRASGNSGIVRCTIQDESGSLIRHDFTIEENVVSGRRILESSSEMNSMPLYLNLEDNKIQISSYDPYIAINQDNLEIEQKSSNNLRGFFVIFVGLVFSTIIYFIATSEDNKKVLPSHKNDLSEPKVITINPYSSGPPSQLSVKDNTIRTIDDIIFQLKI